MKPIRRRDVPRGARAPQRWAAALALAAALGLPCPASADPKTDGQEPCEVTTQFAVDPIGDGALLVGSLAFAGLSEALFSTGELKPQQIDPAFDKSKLLGIDRGAITQTVDKNASGLSSGGVLVAFGYAAVDSVMSGFRYGREAALVDAVMYGEAFAFTWGLTNLAKMSFRRPRPIAYIEREQAIEAGQDPATYYNPSTDSSASFFSGHTALTATLSASATYLAFARSPHTARPWITLAGGVILTSFVGVERVRAAAHFPTDVIAGALVGAGVGVLVVHLHRYDTTKRPVWVGAMPLEGGGGVTLGGLF